MQCLLWAAANFYSRSSCQSFESVGVLCGNCFIYLECVFNLVDLTRQMIFLAGWADSSSFTVHAYCITSNWCFSNTGKKLTYPGKCNNAKKQIWLFIVDQDLGIQLLVDCLQLSNIALVLKPWIYINQSFAIYIFPIDPLICYLWCILYYKQLVLFQHG